MSSSLWPHGLQHSRLPSPSLTPWVCSNSDPLSLWCHPTISSSPPPSPPALHLSHYQVLFKWVGSSHQMAKVFELQHQSFQWIFRFDFLSGGMVWSPCSPRDSQESSPAPQSAFLFYSGLQIIGWGPLTLGRAFCLIQSTDSNVNLIQKYPHRLQE